VGRSYGTPVARFSSLDRRRGLGGLAREWVEVDVERTEGRFPDWTTISADGI